MRTVPFRQVFDRMVRLHGRDPRTNVPSDLRDAIVDHVNDRVRTICQGWRWPEWEITEERAFRQIWRDDHQYLRVSISDGKPDEVFYLGDGFASGDTEFGDNFGYYRVHPVLSGDPPVGTLPTDTDFFEAIDPLDTFIAYDQGCKRAIGMVVGVYNQNPRVPTGSGHGPLKYRPSEKGIDVLCPGVHTVFVSYKMPVPSYTMLPYVVGKTYVRADVVFDPTTGECFQALSTTTSLPANQTFWSRVPFPDKWADYVSKGGFADSLMEFDQGGNVDLQAKMVLQQFWSQQADDALQSEVDALVAQGQKLTWNFGCKRLPSWCESLPWSGGSVTTLSDVCDDALGWLEPTPVQGAAVRWEYRNEIVALLTVDDTPSLQALVTVGKYLADSLVEIVVGDTHMTFILKAGTADPDDAGQVQADDDSDLYWEKVG